MARTRRLDVPSLRPAGARLLTLAAATAGAGVAWQQWLHAHAVTDLAASHGSGTETLTPSHWLLDTALALPAVLLLVLLACRTVQSLAQEDPLRATGRTAVATAALSGLGASVVLAVGGPVHATVLHGPAEHGATHGGGILLHAAREALVGLPVTVAVALGVLLLLQVRPAQPGRRLVAALTGSALVSGLVVGLPVAASAAPSGNGPCPAGARDITYDLAAFENALPLNGWGDMLPDGLQYALKNKDARVGKKQIVENPNLSAPIVVRANVGDCITVKLRNDIAGRRIGIHPDGLVQFDPKTSDGARIGNNPDTTVATGAEKTFTWYADRTGEAPVVDLANLDGAASGGTTGQLGLYGAVIVHPQGSVWSDPVSGADLLAADGTAVQSAVFADVQTPGEDFRSFAMVFMDETEDVVDRNGQQPTFPTTGLADSTFGINYRSEPLRNRLRAIMEYRAGKAITLPNGKTFDPAKVKDKDPAVAAANHFCDGYVPELRKVVDDPGARCLSEESHLQAWIFGDEGKLSRTLAVEAPATAEPADASTVAAAPASDPAAPAGDPAAPASDPAAPAGGPAARTTDPAAPATDAAAPTTTTTTTTPTAPAPAPAKVVTDSDNLIPKAYRGDKIRFHVVHPGASETHPWHQHTQRWRTDPDSPTASDSPYKDVQSVGPGEAFPMEIEGGAGGTQGTIGDSIFHCHLYPHFAQGFWGHLRIFDRLRDGSQSYPDGTPLQALQQLPDRVGATPAATEANPGYPLFVKGDVGQRAYRIPNAVVKDDFAAIRRPGDAPRTGTTLEKANLPALAGGKPGAGYIDPCPSGAPTRTYRPHVIDQKLVYNSAQWTDRQGRIFVEEAQKAAVVSGQKQPEPYTIRARQGECVQVFTTNDLHLDEDPKVPLDHVNRLDGTFMKTEETSEVSTHVHLVKFDQLGSDGTSVGWNYVQAAMPGQTYGYRWYVDTALRTVFFHDHQYANLHQQKGLFAAMNVEPPDSTWHDPKTGVELPQGVGTTADIRVPAGPDFRELTVFHQDRIPLWKDGGAGAPVNPPATPDDFGADQGGYAFNYRNEPFQIRTRPGAAGLKGDPAYVQSSVVHGDPSTPLLRAYSKDPVVIRNVDGAHEEVHTFNLHGHRWLSEPDNLQSTLTDTQTLSLAEYFNYELQSGRPTRKPLSAGATKVRASAGRENGVPEILEGGAGRPGDYLYGSTPLDDQWLGLWGIFRVPAAKVADLQPLPDATGTPKSNGTPWPALAPGQTYPKGSPTRISTCPVDAPKRQYDVTALTMKLVYNTRTGDHDPNAALFVPTADAAGVKAGTKAAEPLVLRANAGDCVQVTLRNALPTTGLPAHTGDVPLPADAPFPSSARVSLHAGLVDYDVTRSDGAAVGYNGDSTTAPGDSIDYTWYVPAKLEHSTINLVDLADRRGHRHHGLFGALLVEPKGATWTNPATGAAAPHGATADVRWTDASGAKQSYREATLQWQDGLNLRDKAGAAIAPGVEVDDPYDRGGRGINYRTERFGGRAGDPADRFSSAVHGDPATPVLKAYAGDKVRIRLLQSSDRGRARTVLLSGHSWNSLPTDPGSRVTSAEGRLLAAEARTMDVVAGAKGPGASRFSGDYLLRDASTVNQVDAGLWGLFRVFDASATQAGLPTL